MEKTVFGQLATDYDDFIDKINQITSEARVHFVGYFIAGDFFQVFEDTSLYFFDLSDISDPIPCISDALDIINQYNYDRSQTALS